MAKDNKEIKITPIAKIISDRWLFTALEVFDNKVKSLFVNSIIFFTA